MSSAGYTADLSDEEIDDICRGYTQNAAKVRFLQSLGVTVARKPNGRPLDASPRVHLRRGHIRRLPTASVWVQPCVVGDKARGVVTKSYLVCAGTN